MPPAPTQTDQSPLTFDPAKVKRVLIYRLGSLGVGPLDERAGDDYFLKLRLVSGSCGGILRPGRATQCTD